MSGVDILRFSCEIALMWMPEDLVDDSSLLTNVMVSRNQSKSHYALKFIVDFSFTTFQ